MKRFGFVVAVVALLGAPAFAKDKPVIERAVDASGQAGVTAPGRPLSLEGRHLHTCSEPSKDCRHPDLSVKVGSRKAMILEAKDTLVKVMVPLATKKGTARVTLEARGRGSAKVSVVVKEKIEDKADGSGGPPDPEDAARSKFSVTGVVYKRSVKGAVFKVTGRAKVPDGLIVRLRLNFDQQTKHVSERTVPVKDGRFETEFGPYRQEVNLGNWRVELFFTLGMQSRGKLRAWLRKLKRDERKAYKRIVRQGHVSVGAGPDGKIPAESLRAARDGLKAHVTPLLAELRTLLEEGRKAYALAARCFYRAKGKSSYDVDAYRAWLVKQGHAADADAAKTMSNDTSYGTRRGHFDAKSYTRYGVKYLATLEKLHQQQEAFDKKTLVPVNDRVSKGVQTALGLGLRLQQKWSMTLHNRAGVPMPAELKREPFRAYVTVQASWKAAQAALKKVEGLLNTP